MSQRQYNLIQAEIIALIMHTCGCDEMTATMKWIESGKAKNFARLMGHEK